jgi:hypothetical protein
MHATEVLGVPENATDEDPRFVGPNPWLEVLLLKRK